MRYKSVFCAAAVLALGACATPRHEVAEVARAHTLVDQAEQAGAQQYASADLEAARNKLQQANDKRTDHDDAVRLADEAGADAEVAIARARAGKAQAALAQVNAGNDTLRQEASRSQDPAAVATEQNHDNQ
jgi:hypothetical protein